ncbi:MAG TPA: alpha/beta hydrolase [Candidatus Eisenbacteria bacterium]|nr:alpha/beta hydrolase [Candidatus Eisenbacteria bacterium]
MNGTALSKDGLAVRYETQGGGSPALVFVHGWSCNRSFWNGQMEPFSRAHQIVVVDLGGHGDSGLDRTDWTIASFGDDVASVADQLDLNQMILIGHSMGGDIILEAARRLPGRVLGLVWVDAYKQLEGSRVGDVGAFTAPFRENFVERTRTYVRGLFPAESDAALVERVAKHMSSAPPQVGLSSLVSALTYYPAIVPTLRELGLPVIAINPDYKPTDVASLEKHGIQVHILPGTGHFLMMERPDRFNDVLRTALRHLGKEP